MFDMGLSAWQGFASNLPSASSLAKLAFGSTAAFQDLSTGGKTGQIPLNVGPACTSPELSCHNSSAVHNLCCFNAPGGMLLLTQFWDAHPATGPINSWTLHGLWPDYCDGKWEGNCDDSRNYKNIRDLISASSSETLEYMDTFWKDYKGNDEQFWQHEWGKHGTCVSTLDPSCFEDYSPGDEVPAFFNRAVSLFKTLPTYEWLAAANIFPSTTARYTSAQIQAALSAQFGGHEVRLGCHNGLLNEVWYFYNVRGSLQAGDFVATDMTGTHSSCPASGIRYLPKNEDTRPVPTSTSRSSPTSRPDPDKPFSGRGQLVVEVDGKEQGCIISQGFWYSSGTCATFRASRSGDHLTITSSKGLCGFVEGILTCGRKVEAAKFDASNGALVYDNSTTYSADRLPGGRKWSTVYAGGDHAVSVEIVWQ